jgi:N6-L-threonylcarbamoyladenine synthase
MNNQKELIWLGGTIDDAAGEAFDKTARLLGFGHGGGFAIQEKAKQYIPHTIDPVFRLPRPMLHDATLNFSFSGLKTAIIREWNKFPEHSDAQICAFAYEVQESITDVLVVKTLQACQLHQAKSILISGGVSSNIRLREKFIEVLSKQINIDAKFYCPPIQLCTDNAAYIGAYAFFRGTPVDWREITADPSLSVEVRL